MNLDELKQLNKLSGEIATLEEDLKRLNRYGIERTEAYSQGYIIHIKLVPDLRRQIFYDIQEGITDRLHELRSKMESLTLCIKAESEPTYKPTNLKESENDSNS